MDLQPDLTSAAVGVEHEPPPRDEDAEDLRVEVVNVDYYLSAPLPERALAKLPASPCYLLARQVPVVRVFGATPAGQKTCVHIHGLFPYFYFRAEDDPAFDDPEQLRRLLPRIAMELEKANELKQQQNQRNRTNGAGPSTDASRDGSDAPARLRRGGAAKLVSKLLIVQGTPFYGYHAGPRLFVQIFLYNPRTVGSVVQLLESGCIAERVFQPYEAHIPFLLQVFADYNIEGMNSIHLSNVMFRAPLPSSQEHLAAAASDHEDLSVLLRSNIPSARVNGDAQSISQIVRGRHVRVPEIASQWFDRQSSCVLEVDVSAECILNRSIARKLQASMANSGEQRNVPSLAALWEEERQRRIQNGETSTPEVSLSVDRKVDATPHPSANVAQSAASSLLSQSFFRKKMEDAITSIIEKLMANSDKHSLEEDSAASNKSYSIDDVTLASSSSSIKSDGEVVTVRHNTIGTKSAFSFSQVEHDFALSETASLRVAPKAQHAEEDQAIIDVLISMQRTTEREWQDQVRSQIQLEDHGALSAASEGEDSDYEVAHASRLDEIGDILASQHPHEHDEDNDNCMRDNDQNDIQAWWDVVQDETKISSSSSLLDLGSPRIDLDSVTLKARRASRLPRARRQIDLTIAGAVTSCNEESEIVPDIETLLPPAPPPRSRKVRVEVEDEEEDSAPFDPLVLSLTPQPRRRRRHPPANEALPREFQNSPLRRGLPSNRKVWIVQSRPPTMVELLASSKPLGIEAVEHKGAFYSVSDDIPEKPLIFSGKKFEFTPVDLVHTMWFDTLGLRKMIQPAATNNWIGMRTQLLQAEQVRQHWKVHRVRTPVRPPPSVATVSRWCHSSSFARSQSTLSQRRKRQRVNQPLTTSLDTKRLSPSSINSNLTVMSIELHANSRGGLLPDPRQDCIEVICYAIEAQEGPTEQKTRERGVIMCKPEEFVGDGDFGFCIEDGDILFSLACDERELISKLEDLVRHWDPDFLAGFEVQKESIGYLVDRASQLNVNLIQTLSRLPTTMVDARNLGAMQVPEDEDGEESGDISVGTTWGVTKASGLWIHGRFILNIWRLARSEVKLSRYSREDIVRAVLKREFPNFSAEQLTDWYGKGGVLRWRSISHTLEKAKCNLQLLSRIQLITRTSEMARLFGMDFYSVLSRGSQYRVESMMLRLTKRNNYLLVSPSRTQVARQAAMECIPLVMEPQSSFYSDPVVVLDFQSLYPSLVIGYNLCYSTIFGRLRDGLHADLETSLGVVDFTPSTEGLIQDRHNLVTVPNGVLISSKAHRLGVLPIILDEILSTRIMVKNAMKIAKQRGDERLEKVLNARQLALKLLSNVTYGYTAAGFSGRMPCAQLADAIVQSGRCTLEAAVRLVEAHDIWNAKVVYGDTDSLFVLLRGRSKEDAFRIGQEIADAVTAANPRPVTLKLEKVYMGSILVSKKRYVGLKFESPEQGVGTIESKGIEIVRRDSCGVVQQSMQRCLELLFATSDLSQVKRSLEEYWLRMLDDQIPLKDFVFAKEVRLGTYARGSAPPAALVSAKAMAKDPRAEPRYAERVPYVVVNGPPGARLMDLVVSPTDFLDRRRGASLSINYQYYIHKQMIPSLERLFLLMGANVRLWYTQLPRVTGKARTIPASAARSSSKKSLETRSIDSFYLSKHCRLCGTMGQNILCQDCEGDPQRSEFVRQVLSACHERSLETLRLICTACGGRNAMDTCGNVSCGVWNRVRLIENGRHEEDFLVKW